jgi:hypothetical protein
MLKIICHLEINVPCGVAQVVKSTCLEINVKIINKKMYIFQLKKKKRRSGP